MNLLDEAEKFFTNLNLRKSEVAKPLTIKQRRALRKAAIAVSNAANKANKPAPKQNLYKKERRTIEALEVPKVDTSVNLTEEQIVLYTDYKKFASPMRRYDVEKLLIKANKNLSSKERESLVDEYDQYAWYYGS